MTAKSDANWVELDPTTLPANLSAAYAEYKEAYKFMKAQREAFEQAMADAASVPAGKRMVFGYNFGKLSVAIVADDRKAKPGKSAQTLAAFMASAVANGHRA